MKQHLLVFAVLSAFFLTVAYGGTKIDIYYKGDNTTDYAIDLAHPEKGKVKLPVGAANIRALAETDKYLVGVTRPEYGKFSPHIFRFDVKGEKLVDFIRFASFNEKGTVPAYAMATGKDNAVYAGTYGDTNTTGKLLKINASGATITVEVLGPVADKKGIFTLALSPSGEKLYGILFPSNGFFVYDLKAKKAEVFKEAELDSTSRAAAHGIHNGPEAALCRALGFDKEGKVYGSTGQGQLFCYDPKTNKVEKLKAFLPYVQFRNATNRVESWALADNGKLYGGTSVDGFLFTFDPATQALVNLGKPITAGNVKGLVIRNNKVHGLAGEGLEYTHYFTYDISQGGFEDLGLLRFLNKLINSRQITYTAGLIFPLKEG
ncbi:MAG: hypothetical protein V1913_01030, partial [Fibrobacterota bacterium]